MVGRAGEPVGLGPDRRAAARGRRGDRLFHGAAATAGVLVVLIVVLITVFLVVHAVPALLHDQANFLTSRSWDVSVPMSFGILQLLWTTVATSVLALAIALPFSVGIALFLTHYAPPWLSRPAAVLIDLLAAVPSIVYGLWGAYIVAPKFAPIQDGIQHLLGWIPLFGGVSAISGGTTMLLVGIVLAIMVLPIMTAINREVLAKAPAAQQEAALAIGATKWEMVRTAVLPYGRAGIISGAMLGLGRALGETIAVMFILSALPQGSAWTWSLFNGGETFASKIASDAAELTPGLGTGAYIAAGLVLFLLTFVVNAVARLIIDGKKDFSE
ncbi:phosphate ABC transporter permease subunit PstC [Leekyejoonella antrihumi]|uniref:phosphate ABC transporter permease subunit PstC n=1 Tax=Leekyejoonella antrihumi TaxID=1660198 RepID=UPI001FE24DA1|nr:phosphate ABC transporter permease subunit PstC [Leekyejoonella antrihumi]